MADTGEDPLRQDEAIEKLLELSKENDWNIPDSIRNALTKSSGSSVTSGDGGEQAPTMIDSLRSERESALAALDDSDLMKDISQHYHDLQSKSLELELRVVDGSYTVTALVDEHAAANNDDDDDEEEEEEGNKKPKRKKQRIETVASVFPGAQYFSSLKNRLLRTGRCQLMPETEELDIMQKVNLRFESGKMYLVLGAPASGKSTLLKQIAGLLPQDDKHVVGGTVSLNGIEWNQDGVYWSNLVAYIDQIDRLHALLTVKETCDFAWQCTSGGNHARPEYNLDDPGVQKKIKEMDAEGYDVRIVLEGLGLAQVSDTFVGDSSVRGVSGGEKKRVTVSEMAVTSAPVICCDEISTGLDAATTYDITKLLGAASRLYRGIYIVSLLQPPPETVANFDELILLSSGQVIYSGPVSDVVPHFEALGYKLPERMDVADWLQSLPTRDGDKYLVADNDEKKDGLSTEEFRESFDETAQAKAIRGALQEPFPKGDGKLLETAASTRLKNSTWRSLMILTKRELLLWWRDKYFIIARIVQDLVYAIIAGTLFWQQGNRNNPAAVTGILFEAMTFASLGSMLKVPEQFVPRSIYYKQSDANFFATWHYVVARSIAGVPISLIDGGIFGIIIYFFVGLAYKDGASVANFFIFMLLLISGSISAGLVFSVFSSTMRDVNSALACMTVTLVLMALFSGFTVQADVIPNYWIWAFWINVFAWILRGLYVNEFQSGKWDTVEPNGLTEGENILIQFGVTDRNGAPYTFAWVWWGFLFAVGASIVVMIPTIYFLGAWRFETGKSLGFSGDDESVDNVVVDSSAVEMPFQRVDLTLKDVHYTVKASTSNEDLELLKGISASIEAEKMTALMGSSGAGKTTLMDVIALRKSTGLVTGEVCLNGHPQDPLSFRRCTGYVEQFDVQSPQLTIRETLDFSAGLRLDSTDPKVTPESTKLLIDQTLSMLELTSIQDFQVGDDQSGGLSFEQTKRLSIAVELVANPSIIFLDEPTSGLDARAAAIVVRGMKRIAESGRAVCATIHQPSIAIFNSFDSLLLLKRGGETVFFGDLGEESTYLIRYLESFEATPKIRALENPATWMLTTIGAGSSGTATFDYAGAYATSKLQQDNLARIDEICSSATEQNLISYPTKYATSRRTQTKAILKRITTIYWRSPSYNFTRMAMAVLVALLFGSVYVSQRTPENESDMNSRVTSIFISMLFLSSNSFTTILDIFQQERNMMYRHKFSLMYYELSIIVGFFVAETPFILVTSLLFVVIFYFFLGFAIVASKFFLYYMFFTLNLFLWTFFGTMAMSLVRDSITAQAIGGILIGITGLFAGVLLRPQFISAFWEFMYWLTPGHYAMEGLLVSQFYQDNTPIEASPGTPYWDALNCGEQPSGSTCSGTAEQWVAVTFGGEFKYEHIGPNAGYFVGVTVLFGLTSYVALIKLNYLAT